MAAVRTVRISDRAHQALGRIKQETGRSMTELLDASVQRLEDELTLARLNAGYGELRGDSRAWAQELEQRGAWDATLADGLERQ